MAKSDGHDLVCAVKELALELRRTPTRREFCGKTRGGEYKITKFGGYTALLQAAGLETYDDRRCTVPDPTAKREAKLVRAYRALCSKREQIQGFFRSTLDLAEMFERAGNPPVLKVSAQPDTHAKYRDVPAFNCYLAFLRVYQPHVHLIMGDFVDCEGLSHWPEDSLEPRRIVPEMKLARALLQEIVDATPSASSRLFITGNHEAWIDQAFTKMPELFDGLAELDIEISLKTLLGLPKFGYELFPLNEIVQIGKAHFTHGLYTGDNHAKKHLKVLKSSVYYAHLHDMQEHNETSMDGNLECGTFGCLCRLDAKFLKGKPNNWVHGHATFEFLPDGTYHWSKHRIYSGRSTFNGQVLDGNT
jgi:hypothetical protein